MWKQGKKVESPRVKTTFLSFKKMKVSYKETKPQMDARDLHILTRQLKKDCSRFIQRIFPTLPSLLHHLYEVCRHDKASGFYYPGSAAETDLLRLQWDAF